MNSRCAAYPGTDATAKTHILLQHGLLSFRPEGIIRRNQTHCPHRAYLHASAATRAPLFIDRRQEIRRVYRVEHAKSAGCDHGLAETPATVANETDLLTNVFADLNA